MYGARLSILKNVIAELSSSRQRDRPIILLTKTRSCNYQKSYVFKLAVICATHSVMASTQKVHPSLGVCGTDDAPINLKLSSRSRLPICAAPIRSSFKPTRGAVIERDFVSSNPFAIKILSRSFICLRSLLTVSPKILDFGQN